MSHNLAARTEQIIRSKLASYLAKNISLRAFAGWFIPASWEIEDAAPPEVRELIYGIKLRLAEFTSGYSSEDQLRAALLPFVRTVVIGASSHPSIKVSCETSWAFPPRFRGRRQISDSKWHAGERRVVHQYIAPVQPLASQWQPDLCLNAHALFIPLEYDEGLGRGAQFAIRELGDYFYIPFPFY